MFVNIPLAIGVLLGGVSLTPPITCAATVTPILNQLNTPTFIQLSLSGSTPPIAHAATVSDFAQHPNKANIDFVLQNKIMSKYSDGRFKPNETITQSQMIASLVTIFQLKDKEEVKEIPVGNWAKDMYEKAKKAGVLENITINPNQKLNKEEAGLLITNAFKKSRTLQQKGGTFSQTLTLMGWLPKGGTYKGEMLLTRGDAARTFSIVHRYKTGMDKGEESAKKFDADLKIEKNTIKGTVPKIGGLKQNVSILLKNGKSLNYKDGQSFKVNLADVVNIAYTTSLTTGNSDYMAWYLYDQLPLLNKKNRLLK